MPTAEYVVTGMTCAHCERAIETEIRGLPGVRAVQVCAATGRLVIASDEPIAGEAVLAAVDEAGYQAVPAGSE